MSNKAQALSWRRLLNYAWLAFALPASIASASGGIATDGTMGVVQTLSGANVTIPQGLGTTAGNNLFHSFAEFNIASGQTVEFTGSDTLQNVISRVTGTDVTAIDGTLKSSIGNAAFYFINPNGIAFGANASVDVPGDFHISTADKIDFPNGAVLFADSNPVGTLSSEAPSAFGFIATSAANNGLIGINGTQLAVKNGQTQDIVAGEITIENGAVLSAPAGEIRLVAMQDIGSVGLQANLNGALPLPAESPSAGKAGAIAIRTGGIDTSGNGAGRIAIWGGKVSLKDATAFAGNNGNINAVSAKGVAIRSYSLNADNSVISSNVIASGSTGNVKLETSSSLDIVNGGSVESNNFDFRHENFYYGGTGKLGNIMVKTDKLRVDGQANSYGSAISSQALFAGSNQAGNVTVQAKDLNVLNGGQVFSSKAVTINTETMRIDNAEISSHPDFAFGAALGGDPGGNVTIIGAKKLDILNGGSVSVSSVDSKAGTIKVQADVLTIDGQGNPSSRTGIFSESTGVESAGAPGSIDIQVEKLAILNGGKISSSSNNAVAGSIEVEADTLSIDGHDNPSRTGIFSEANEIFGAGYGYGSDITVRAGTLKLDNLASISSDTYSLGHAGTVRINAGTLEVLGASNISSASIGRDSGGIPGNVMVTAHDGLHLADGGHISIENEADKLYEPNFYVPGFLFGTINIEAPEIDIQNGWITSNSSGNVAAGIIVVNFSRWLTMDSSFITTTANTGDGGDIIISKNGSEFISLLNSGFITSDNGINGDDIVNNTKGGEVINLHQSGFKTSVNGADSNGGDIFTKADILVMDAGLIQANAVGGSGGDITLDFKALIPSGNTLILGGAPVGRQTLLSGFNLIQAASAEGVSGNLSVTAPQLNLSGILANFGGPQFEISRMSLDNCGLAKDSSLIHRGDGGLKPKNSDLRF